MSDWLMEMLSFCVSPLVAPVCACFSDLRMAPGPCVDTTQRGRVCRSSRCVGPSARERALSPGEVDHDQFGANDLLRVPDGRGGQLEREEAVGPGRVPVHPVGGGDAVADATLEVTQRVCAKGGGGGSGFGAR